MRSWGTVWKTHRIKTQHTLVHWTHWNTQLKQLTHRNNHLSATVKPLWEICKHGGSESQTRQRERGRECERERSNMVHGTMQGALFWMTSERLCWMVSSTMNFEGIWAESGWSQHQILEYQQVFSHMNGANITTVRWAWWSRTWPWSRYLGSHQRNHQAAVVQNWFTSHNQIEVLYSPPESPFLNPREQSFLAY